MTQTISRAQAYPAKRFFVDMLVRDIELHDAILDLLDNCVDGAMRTSSQNPQTDPARPYEGYFAEINFDEAFFSIVDNCGGIPVPLAMNYAFRMGRADSDRDSDLATVGIYGIGMKRAVFKLGKHTEIRSRTQTESFSLTIPSTWLEDDDDWELPLEISDQARSSVGTEIRVTDLRDGIPRIFADETDFERTLKNAVAAYYGYIIEKGFKVIIKGEEILPVKVALIADDFSTKEGVRPYVYEGNIDGVSVVVTVGLYRPLPNDDEEDAALQGRPSSERAGWTIVCNDRVVLFADKTRATGWGEATVPQYHTQFISIAGTVILKSGDVKKLPLTTTKRGVDGNSELYLSVKEFMREGLKIFTDFTNKWKKSSKELHGINSQLATVNPNMVNSHIPDNSWSKVMKGAGGRRYKPLLPLPKEDDPIRQIRFSRRVSEIADVATYLFDDPTVAAGMVGEKCFDDVLKKARQ